jgi:PIN domain nuclease of toxin-antitoxin system
LKYLLDTRVALWSVVEPHKLNSRATAALAEPSSILYISSASVWEIAIKYATGNLRLHAEPQAFISELVDELKSEPLAISHRHAVEAGGLPRHHDDPFDRMLIAQARVEGLILLSADRMMKNYEVELLLCGR